MRCVLGLFEGVVTAAADGYARMADKPAATLLHLGPGLANGLANLHNARRARTPMINVVGDHATYHLQHDAPLTSDIESLANPMSQWVRRIAGPESVCPDTAAAYRAAMSLPGVATLILPANAAWGEIADTPVTRAALPPPEPIDPAAVRIAVDAIRSGRRVALLMTGRALRADALEIAGRIARSTDVRLLAPTSNSRIERGAGRVTVSRFHIRSIMPRRSCRISTPLSSSAQRCRWRSSPILASPVCWCVRIARSSSSRAPVRT